MRKYFGTDGVRGRVGDQLINPQFVVKLGWSLGNVLAARGKSKVLIGKDTRISGYMLESALEAGLSAAGVDIHLLGPMPTPGIAYLTRTLRAQAGIVISASHNSYKDNGIKLFSELGYKFSDEFELAIEKEIAKEMRTVVPENLGKAIRLVDAPGRYIEFCKSTIPANMRLSGLKIVLDAANGAAYHIAGNVFRELGADVIEMNVYPDGININAECGSTSPQRLQKIVLAESANVGIALDGDGDRVIMIDSKGNIVDGDEILYIIAKFYKIATQQPLDGVVGTLMSNLGLEKAFHRLDVAFLRSQVGDRYVIEKLMEKKWFLGGESSGHIICLHANTTGDGIIASLQALAAMCYFEKPLHDLSKEVEKYPQKLINVNVSNRSILKNEVINKAKREIEAKLAKRGRVLLRPSGTEPLIRVMIEGENAKEITQLAEELADIVRKEDA